MGKTIRKELFANIANTAPLTREQLAAGRKAMEAAFVALLAIDERENIYWTGSQTDLVELARVAYEGGIVRDAQGSPVPFTKLVRAVFAKLHTVAPYNPYNAAALAQRRKGVRRSTLLERFCWLKYIAGHDNPLSAELQQM